MYIWFHLGYNSSITVLNIFHFDKHYFCALWIWVGCVWDSKKHALFMVHMNYNLPSWINLHVLILHAEVRVRRRWCFCWYRPAKEASPHHRMDSLRERKETGRGRLCDLYLVYITTIRLVCHCQLSFGFFFDLTGFLSTGTATVSCSWEFGALRVRSELLPPTPCT